ncbi:MAG: NCS2 family permease [Bacteroidales bacterium]|nr:NCS2 family permease [Bacteroidales bacterium]
MSFLDRYFKITDSGSTIRKEITAGLTTFFTMSYIIIVNPKILEAAGIPFGPSMVATIISAFFGTLAMGVYAKRPFAIAPYMGENVFIAFTVVKLLGYTWQQALGAIFVSGVLFTLLTIFGIRKWLAQAIPASLKIAFAVGIGLFLTFIGLNETGIIQLGNPGAPVQLGDITQPGVYLALAGIVLIGILMIRKVPGAILISMIIITLIAIFIGEVSLPKEIVSRPPKIAEIAFKMDLKGIWQWGFFPVILTVFVMDFVDTMGTLLGVSLKAGFLDKEGNLPEIEKPMLCDALATVFGALMGTTTTGTFIESATGIQAGGRTGFTSVITAFLFLLALFFAPLFAIVPAFAYGPALIIVGMLLFEPVTKLNFNDLSDIIPSFIVIVLMSFTYNLGIGMTAGFIVYPIIKLISGKGKEVSAGIWVLAAISVLFYIFYPY